MIVTRSVRSSKTSTPSKRLRLTVDHRLCPHDVAEVRVRYRRLQVRVQRTLPGVLDVCRHHCTPIMEPGVVPQCECEYGVVVRRLPRFRHIGDNLQVGIQLHQAALKMPPQDVTGTAAGESGVKGSGSLPSIGTVESSLDVPNGIGACSAKLTVKALAFRLVCRPDRLAGSHSQQEHLRGPVPLLSTGLPPTSPLSVGVLMNNWVRGLGSLV